MSLKLKRGNLKSARSDFTRISRGIDQTVVDALAAIGGRIVSQANKNLAEKVPYPAIASGQLSRSFYVSVNKGTKTVSVGNRAPHALVVEFGRRPGKKMPPPRDVRDWLLAKGMPADSRNVYLISKKIVRDGIKGLYYMSRAVDAVIPTARKTIDDAVDKYLKHNNVLKD